MARLLIVAMAAVALVWHGALPQPSDGSRDDVQSNVDLDFPFEYPLGSHHRVKRDKTKGVSERFKDKHVLRINYDPVKDPERFEFDKANSIADVANNRVRSSLYGSKSIGKKFTLIVTHANWEDDKLDNLKAEALPGSSGQDSQFRSKHAFTMIEYDVGKINGQRTVSNPHSGMRHIIMNEKERNQHNQYEDREWNHFAGSESVRYQVTDRPEKIKATVDEDGFSSVVTHKRGRRPPHTRVEHGADPPPLPAENNAMVQKQKQDKLGKTLKKLDKIDAERDKEEKEEEKEQQEEQDEQEEQEQEEQQEQDQKEQEEEEQREQEEEDEWHDAQEDDDDEWSDVIDADEVNED